MTLDAVTLEPESAFFMGLGYENITYSAVIANNFWGFGLPDYLWKQVANLLYKVDATISADLTCEAMLGGTCKLKNDCY